MLFHYATKQGREQSAALGRDTSIAIVFPGPLPVQSDGVDKRKIAPRSASLNRGRSAWGRCRVLCYVLNNHARQEDPKLADRLVSVLFSRIVQTDTVLGRDERRSQIPSQADLFVIHPGWPFH